MTAFDQISAFLDLSMEGLDCYVVEMKVKPTNNFKIYLDSDTGFTLEKCMKINRSLRNKIDESGLFPEGDYSLEVSSPGVDLPLKLLRQYRKNVGRTLDITFNDAEKPELNARLTAVEEDQITVQPIPKTKRGQISKTAPEPIVILLTDIKSAVVCIEF